MSYTTGDGTTGSSDYSPAPGTPQTATKAGTAGTIAAALLAIVSALIFMYDEKNGTNFGEILSAILIGLGGGGLTGLATYRAKNRLK